MSPWITRFIVALLVLGIAGVPEAFAEAAQNAPQQTTDPQNQKPAQPATVMPDPAAGPLAPVPSDQQDVPNAPSSSRQPAQPATQTAPATAPQAQQPKQEQPLGAAAAEASKTSGGLASKPAGTAIAPAKQRQVRSLLIKLGAIAAGGAALGAIYGLTRGTSSVPPHASAAATAAH